MAFPIAFKAILSYTMQCKAIYNVTKGVKIALNRIKEVRESMGMTQKELAIRAGVSQPFIHDLENNNRGAKRETIERIANALGVSVDDLKEEKAG